MTGIDGLRLTQGAGSLEIGSLASDSRSVEAGAMFFALPGERTDGSRFIVDALDKGAVALVAPEAGGAPFAPNGVALVLAQDARHALARMAAKFHSGQPATVAAITGTGGKTSTAAFLRQLWSLEGRQCASLGTLGVISPVFTDPGQLTTPDPVKLHQILSRLSRGGVTHLAMEASSHGLDQRRLDGVEIAAAAFTNLSHDHLDYHETMESYFEAKLRLFTELMPAGGTAVISTELTQWEALAQMCQERHHRVIVVNADCSRLGLGEVRLVGRHATSDGQIVTLEAFGRDATVEFPVAGLFQAANLLTAIALAVGCGSDIGKILGQIERLTGVPGRIEHVCNTPSGGAVYVDYAHKPGALESVLSTLRPHASGRLVVVFGCGGDRDRAKRPAMGKIAIRLADQVFVTDDNPRSETPAAIRAEILATAPGAIEIGDRAEAIRAAMQELKSGDILVIAGKGHETYQIVGAATLPFDDGEVARRVAGELAERAA
jgi:UDP-N-acetylmuramoyl-L-alanyl-D-glutamate--2,6-diaminopimelate ligase